MWAIDPWEGDEAGWCALEALLAPYAGRAGPWRARGAEVVERFGYHSLDVLYVDGLDDDEVGEALAAWWFRLRVGGLLVGGGGGATGFDAFCRTHGLVTHVFGHRAAEATWIAQRRV